MFEFGSSLSVRAVRGESAPARTVRKCGFRWHIRCIAGLRSRKKGRSRWSRRSANIPYCRLSVQDDCFVKDRVGSRLEIVGIGRFLLRVLYSVLIGPFDVVFHLSVECTVLVRYIGLHINFLNRRYPASVFMVAPSSVMTGNVVCSGPTSFSSHEGIAQAMKIRNKNHFFIMDADWLCVVTLWSGERPSAGTGS